MVRKLARACLVVVPLSIMFILVFQHRSSQPVCAQCPTDCEYTIDGYGCNSPIIVDTMGKGITLTSPANGVRFDIRGDGHPILLSWTRASSGDAFLALDRDANGRIDNGTELFGNWTPQPESDHKNGFAALAEYDKPQQGGN